MPNRLGMGRSCVESIYALTSQFATESSRSCAESCLHCRMGSHIGDWILRYDPGVAHDEATIKMR